MRQRRERGFLIKPARAKGIIEIHFNKYVLTPYEPPSPGLSTKTCEVLTGSRSEFITKQMTIYFMRGVFLFCCLFFCCFSSQQLATMLHTEEALRSTKDTNEPILGYITLGENLVFVLSCTNQPPFPIIPESVTLILYPSLR